MTMNDTFGASPWNAQGANSQNSGGKSTWTPHSAPRAALLALAAAAFLTFARPAIAQAPPTFAEMRRVWAQR
jgi:hypothetical protein